MKTWGRRTISALSLLFAGFFFVYPALTCAWVLLDPAVRTTGQSRLITFWFRQTASRYERWADRFLADQRAAHVNPEHVAATEWPMFGSVFFLLTAEQLHTEGRVDARSGAVRRAVDRARDIVVSRDTATWVRHKWGDTYLERENVFYRMLLMMGLTAHARITGATTDHDLLHTQWTGLARELLAAPHHVLDDYPGECYPVDVVWSVAAIQRAAALEGTNANELAWALMQSLNGPLQSEGLPAYQVGVPSGYLYQSPRGCGNSGLLLFAPDLNADLALTWYHTYASNFWKSTGWLAGFTEMPRGSTSQVMDVDSGPIMADIGSVASAFGIGAARRAGDLDRVAQLTWQAVACSWPTPAGLLTPGLMGHFAVDGWCLGEVALLFSMTRPLPAGAASAATTHAPGIVWGLLLFYSAAGAWFILREIQSLRRHATPS
jgi:hypothetical protein